MLMEVGVEEAQSAGGPTVLRRLLGAQLRRLRERQGITREEAGYAIRASGSKMSRLELGRVGFKERDVADLLTLYGVNDETDRDSLLRLAQDANTPGWWHRYGDVLPGWFETYVGLEEAAALVRTYEVQFTPACCRPRNMPVPSSPWVTRPRRQRRSSRGSACGQHVRSYSHAGTPPVCGLSWTRRRCAVRSGDGM